MKKFLSTVLAVTMLLALFVPQTMAEEATESAVTIVASGTSVVEVENFAEASTALEAASGGALFYNTWKIIDQEESYTITMPVTVTETGAYSTEYAVTKAVNGVSAVKLYVDGKLIGNNTGDGLETVHAYDQYFILNKYAGNNVYLTAGDHTITIVATKTSDKDNNGTTDDTTDDRNLVKFGADYVSFTRAAATVMPNSGATLEFEEYSAKFVVENEKASGGKLVHSQWTTGYPTYQIVVPVSVDAPGYYKVSYKLGKQSSGSLSLVTVMADGAVLGTNGSTVAGTDISEDKTYPWNYTPMHEYQGENVFFEAGEHVIVLDIGTTGDGVAKFAADSITFTKVPGTVVPAEGKILEVEDFVTTDIVTLDAASGGKTFYNNWK